MESVLSVGRVRVSDRELERKGERKIDVRSRRGEIQRPITCDLMMLARLSARLGSETRTLEQRERGRKRRNRNIVDGIRRKRSRQVLRPRRNHDSLVRG